MKSKKYSAIIIFFIIIQGIILINFFFCHHFDHAMFESDAASEVVLAESLAEEGSLALCNNWYYSTEVRIVYDHLIMAPLYKLTGSYLTTFAVTNIIIMILMFAAVMFCLTGLGMSVNGSMLGGLLMLIPYGSYRRYSPFAVFLGDCYYSFHLILSFLLLGLYFRWKKSENSKIIKWLNPIIIFVVAIGMGLSGLRYAMVLLLPLMIYEVMNFFIGNEQNLWKESCKAGGNIKKVIISLLPYAGYFIGFVISKKWISPAYGGKNFTQSAIASIGDLREQFLQVLLGFFQMFGFSMDHGKLLSVIGLFSLVCLGYLVLVIALLVDSLKQTDKILKDYALFSLIQFITDILLLMFIYNQDLGATIRYFWAGAFLLFLLPAVWLERRSGIKKRFVVLIAIGCLAVFMANNANLVMSYNINNRFVQSYGQSAIKNYYRNATPAEREGYISFLEENGLFYGYSTFWNANITTVLTENKVIIVGVNNDQWYSTFEWLTKKSYTDRENFPPQFYLLTGDEEATRLQNGWEMFGTEAYRDNKFVIYVSE